MIHKSLDWERVRGTYAPQQDNSRSSSRSAADPYAVEREQRLTGILKAQQEAQKLAQQQAADAVKLAQQNEKDRQSAVKKSAWDTGRRLESEQEFTDTGYLKERNIVENQQRNIEAEWEEDERAAKGGIFRKPDPEAAQRIDLHKQAWNENQAKINALDTDIYGRKKALPDLQKQHTQNQARADAINDADASREQVKANLPRRGILDILEERAGTRPGRSRTLRMAEGLETAHQINTRLQEREASLQDGDYAQNYVDEMARKGIDLRPPEQQQADAGPTIDNVKRLEERKALIEAQRAASAPPTGALGSFTPEERDRLTAAIYEREKLIESQNVFDSLNWKPRNQNLAMVALESNPDLAREIALKYGVKAATFSQFKNFISSPLKAFATIKSAKEAHEKWDTMTPEQQQELLTLSLHLASKEERRQFAQAHFNKTLESLTPDLLPAERDVLVEDLEKRDSLRRGVKTADVLSDGTIQVSNQIAVSRDMDKIEGAIRGLEQAGQITPGQATQAIESQTRMLTELEKMEDQAFLESEHFQSWRAKQGNVSDEQALREYRRYNDNPFVIGGAFLHSIKEGIPQIFEMGVGGAQLTKVLMSNAPDDEKAVKMMRIVDQFSAKMEREQSNKPQTGYAEFAGITGNVVGQFIPQIIVPALMGIVTNAITKNPKLGMNAALWSTRAQMPLFAGTYALEGYSEAFEILREQHGYETTEELLAADPKLAQRIHNQAVDDMIKGAIMSPIEQLPLEVAFSVPVKIMKKMGARKMARLAGAALAMPLAETGQEYIAEAAQSAMVSGASIDYKPIELMDGKHLAGVFLGSLIAQGPVSLYQHSKTKAANAQRRKTMQKAAEAASSSLDAAEIQAQTLTPRSVIAMNELAAKQGFQGDPRAELEKQGWNPQRPSTATQVEGEEVSAQEQLQSDPLAILLAKKEMLQTTDISGLPEMQQKEVQDYLAATEAAINAHPDYISEAAANIASELTGGAVAQIQDLKAKAAEVKTKLESLIPPDTDMVDDQDWQDFQEYARTADEVLKAYISKATGDGIGDKKEQQRFREVLPIAKEIAAWPDEKADPDGNNVRNGSSQREIAKAIYNLAQTGVLSPDGNGLIGGNRSKIFGKGADGRTVITNNDTLAALKQAAPLLHQQYENYLQRPLPEIKQAQKEAAQPKAAEPQQSATPDSGAAAVEPEGGKSEPTPGKYRVVAADPSAPGQYAVVAEIEAGSQTEAERIARGEAPMPDGSTIDTAIDIDGDPIPAGWQTKVEQLQAPRKAGRPKTRTEHIKDISTWQQRYLAFKSNIKEAKELLKEAVEKKDQKEIERLTKGIETLTQLQAAEHAALQQASAEAIEFVHEQIKPWVVPISKQMFDGGYHITAESAGSGGMHYRADTKTLEISALEMLQMDFDADTIKEVLRAIVAEEVLHATADKALTKKEVESLWNAASPSLKEATLEAYPSLREEESTDFQRGHELLAFLNTRNVRIDLDTGVASWDEAGSQRKAEQVSPTLIARFRSALQKMAEYLQGIKDAFTTKESKELYNATVDKIRSMIEGTAAPEQQQQPPVEPEVAPKPEQQPVQANAPPQGRKSFIKGFGGQPYSVSPTNKKLKVITVLRGVDLTEVKSSAGTTNQNRRRKTEDDDGRTAYEIEEKERTREWEEEKHNILGDASAGAMVFTEDLQTLSGHGRTNSLIDLFNSTKPEHIERANRHRELVVGFLEDLGLPEEAEKMRTAKVPSLGQIVVDYGDYAAKHNGDIAAAQAEFVRDSNTNLSPDEQSRSDATHPVIGPSILKLEIDNDGDIDLAKTDKKMLFRMTQEMGFGVLKDRGEVSADALVRIRRAALAMFLGKDEKFSSTITKIVEETNDEGLKLFNSALLRQAPALAQLAEIRPEVAQEIRTVIGSYIEYRKNIEQRKTNSKLEFADWMLDQSSFNFDGNKVELSEAAKNFVRNIGQAKGSAAIAAALNETRMDAQMGSLFSQKAITQTREEAHRAPFPDVARPNFKLRSQSAKPTTDEPWTLDESDFLKWSDFNDRIVDFYNKARVDSGDTSRSLPMAPLDLQVGQWMIDPVKGLHGREIAQLRLVDTADLQPVEDNVPRNIEGRGDDSARYQQWLDQGLTPPPINVVETDKGSLRITDGHRRYYAHKAAGRPILAWVWPAMDHPDGAKADGGAGPILRVGMTLEAIKASQPITPATSTRVEDIKGSTQFSNAIVTPPGMTLNAQPVQLELFDYANGLSKSEAIKPTKQDGEYLRLARSPMLNEDALREIVKQAAFEAGYQVHAYHGTPGKPFDVFDIRRLGQGSGNTGLYSSGFYFSPRLEAARSYTEGRGSVLEVFLKIQNPMRITEGFTAMMEGQDSPEMWSKIESERQAIYKILFSGKEFDLQAALSATKDEEFIGDFGHAFEAATGTRLESIDDVTAILSKMVKQSGFDGIFVSNHRGELTEIVAFYPHQIKKADPITKVGGEIVPPSKRFDSEKDSMLFSQTPGRAYESMDFNPPFKTPFGEILTYNWMSDGRSSDWSQAKTNPETGRKIVHHFKARRPNGSEYTVSLETAMGQLSKDQAGKLNRMIKAEMQRRTDAAGGQMFLLSQRAYHGTPHTIDPKEGFRLDKVGTGEGAQAYGHGLYFAEAQQVANTYIRAGTGKRAKELETPNGKIDISELPTALAKAFEANWEAPNPIQNARNFLNGWSGEYLSKTIGIDAVEEAKQKLTELEQQGVKTSGGNLYTVSLDVENDQLLDWDKPLSEQSEKVREAVVPIIKKLSKSFPEAARSDINGSGIYNSYAQHRGGNTQAVSEDLLAAGIPGIRYLDGQSRGVGLTAGALSVQEDAAGQGYVIVKAGGYFESGPYETKSEADQELAKRQSDQTYNYVIFDPKRIKITHRNDEALNSQAAQTLPDLTPEAREGVVSRYQKSSLRSQEPQTFQGSGDMLLPRSRDYATAEDWKKAVDQDRERNAKHLKKLTLWVKERFPKVITWATGQNKWLVMSPQPNDPTKPRITRFLTEGKRDLPLNDMLRREKILSKWRSPEAYKVTQEENDFLEKTAGMDESVQVAYPAGHREYDTVEEMVKEERLQRYDATTEHLFSQAAPLTDQQVAGLSQRYNELHRMQREGEKLTPAQLRAMDEAEEKLGQQLLFAVERTFQPAEELQLEAEQEAPQRPQGEQLALFSQQSKAINALNVLTEGRPLTFNTGNTEQRLIDLVTQGRKAPTGPLVLRIIPIDAAKPVQGGEDYINESSRETARRIATGDFMESRWKDALPVLLNEDGTINDGHHRHAAATINGDKFIAAVMPADAPLARTGKPMFAQEREDALFSQAPAFYSQLESVIEAKMPARASSEQIKGIINPEKGSGVKAEEIKWSGIIQWLDERKGATKEEVLAHLRNEGAVRFEEVRLDESTLPSPRQARIWLADRGDLPDEPFSDPQEYVNTAVILGMNESRGTEYTQYQLPGGTNYREVVLAMPIDASGYMPVLRQNRRGEWEVYEPDTDNSYILRAADRVNAEREAAPIIARRAKEARASSQNYTSSHFPDVPNYVAHMRLNERDGGLFIEELQSDRHQEGRKKGYRGEPPAIIEDGGKFGLAGYNRWYSSRPEAEIASRELNAGIADAPYRKDWQLALFKRALRDAVESGKEWIGWTTGETQAERYDLSKQIKEVSYYYKDGDSTGQLVAVAIDGRSAMNERNVSPDKLEDYIGKDVAKKLMEAPDNGGMRTLSGLELKVGGEGMKGFYDQILPKEIQKYVKQWGAKVEKAKIDISGGKPLTGREPNSQQDGVSEIWRVTITPQMRESIQTKGQALFSQRATPQQAGQLLLAFDAAPKPPAKIDRKKPLKALDGEQRKLVMDNIGLAGWAASRYNIAGMDDQDIRQEAIIAMATAAQSYDPERGPFGPLAGRSIANRISSLIRRTVKTERTSSLQEPLVEDGDITLQDTVTGPNLSPDFERQESMRVLQAAIDQLPARAADILRRIGNGESMPNIATALGMSRQRIEAMSKRAAQQIRQKLYEKGITTRDQLFADNSQAAPALAQRRQETEDEAVTDLLDAREPDAINSQGITVYRGITGREGDGPILVTRDPKVARSHGTMIQATIAPDRLRSGPEELAFYDGNVPTDKVGSIEAWANPEDLQPIRSQAPIQPVTKAQAEQETGRAQPDSEYVLTPAGPRRIGSLEVGDTILTPDGHHKQQVEGIYPQGEMDIVEIQTESGRVTRASLDHLWLAVDDQGKVYAATQTEALRPGWKLPVLA